MIIDNLVKIRCRMDAAARRAGRNPNDVSLLAVTKYAPLPAVKELLVAGAASALGENRVQDALRRQQALGALAQSVRWRMIGHLQTNKAKQAVAAFDAIDSLDSIHTALAIERRLAETDKRLAVLVEVKLAPNENQSGVAPEQAARLVAEMERLPHLQVEGLMGIAPAGPTPETARPAFRLLKVLFDQIFAGRPGARLSMGTSQDFEVAIEEGATMVRIGTALFSGLLNQ